MKKQQNNRRVQENKKKRRSEKQNRRSKKNILGGILMGIQAVVSGALLMACAWLGILPMKYMVMIALILLCLWLIFVLSQVRRKRSGGLGKFYSIVLTMILGAGVYYISITTNLIGQISGNSFKTELVVVAVLAEDSAQSIQDAADYDFGVQFDKGAETMEDALRSINEEVGREISTVQCDNLEAQAEALYSGDVQAIVYDNAYAGVVESALAEYGETPRVIYKKQVKVQMNLEQGNDDSLVEEPFMVYISGLDVYEETKDEGSRSDVNILAAVNPKTHQILLVTTPRDYYVVIPGVSEGMYDKLTHAGSYGIDTSMATLEELYETEINYYAQVNFTSLIQIIDILGGVDVMSEQSFTTSINSGCVMDVQEGMNHFDGKQALAFARERKNVEGGDLQRGRDQQAVITAMIKKVLSPAMLLKANSILNTVGQNVETNVTQEQINALIRYQLRENPKWSIASLSAEGAIGEDYCYSAGDVLSIIYQDEESINHIIEQINIVESGNGTLEDGEVLN